MLHPVIKVAGFVLTGVILIGLLLTVIIAASAKHPFYGVNYLGLLLGTYSTLAAFILAAGVVLFAVIFRVRRALTTKWN